jgi:hypothetical protein
MVIFNCAAVAIFCTARRERSDRFGCIIRNDDAENYAEEDQPLKQTRFLRKEEKYRTFLRVYRYGKMVQGLENG